MNISIQKEEGRDLCFLGEDQDGVAQGRRLPDAAQGVGDEGRQEGQQGRRRFNGRKQNCRDGLKGGPQVP